MKNSARAAATNLSESVAPNKHQQKTQETKQKLIRAARRIFSRDGFEGARIEDIAADAGYTRGAFYAHFKRKEDLFFALVEQQSSQRVEKLRRLLQNCVPQERLNCMREFFATSSADKQLAILILEFELYAIRHGKLRAKLAEVHRSIRAKIRLELPPELRADAELGELQKVVFRVLINGLLLEHAYDPSSISEDQIGHVLRQLFDSVVQLKRV